MKKKLKYSFLSILIYSFSCLFCYPSDVLYIDLSSKKPLDKLPFKIACEFYGLDSKQLILKKQDNNVQLVDMFEHNDFHAILISARALGALDKKKLFSLLKKGYEKEVPLLVLDVSSDIESNLLRQWSGGGLLSCASSADVPPIGSYQIFDNKEMARELSGLKIPFVYRNINYFICNKDQIDYSIIQVSINATKSLFPIFIKTAIDEQEVFFLAQNQFIKSYASLNKKEYHSESIFELSNQYDKHILQLLPILMFLRYAFGQYCWHSTGHYANLTIDDPWLTDPYGHFSYKRLLKQMEISNFHTTIGFIPWNYDRSESEVVNLIRNNPSRFSICIHGNNHDHYEFYKYETGIGDPWLPKPLHVQEANIKQAIARLEEFKRMTGLPYEPVMVFPHGIAPAKTLGLLKKYNFQATVNAGNVPLGLDRPESLLFSLRPVTIAFENFASVIRYKATKKSQVDMAIDLFLGNPLLLYEHHQFFVDGIDAFNEVADKINRLEPGIEWKSLGYIARHLYLQRVRDDGKFDIRAFCKSIEIENPAERDVTYFIRKEESFSLSIKQVTENGKACIVTKEEGSLSFSITIPAGGRSIIDIEYDNNLDLESIDISKNNARVNRLRKLSDLRDIKLSKNVLGRVIISVYYDTGMYKIGLKRLAVIGFLLALLMGAGIWFIIRNIKKRRLRKQEA